MSAERPRNRFVPTLTEVVVPAGELPAELEPRVQEAAVLAAEHAPSSRSSMLESAVDGLMPQAREQMRQRLHAVAYALAEEQLHAMEDSLRQQLRVALREATGMGGRS